MNKYETERWNLKIEHLNEFSILADNIVEFMKLSVRIDRRIEKIKELETRLEQYPIDSTSPYLLRRGDLKSVKSDIAKVLSKLIEGELK